MTSDYTWNADGSLDDEFVPVELVPRRFAFAAPQCIVREDGALLLVDPHEVGTWMTWMFPYASLVLDGTDGRIASTVARDVEDAESLTFGDISEVLARLRETVRADYSAAIRSEMNNVVAGIRRGWVGAPFAENFSLKFSKTSKSYTAYAFEYYRLDVDGLSTDVPHLWVPLDDARRYLGDQSRLQDRSVSSNVWDVVDVLAP